MLKRILSGAGTLAALSALALGGSAIASAQSSHAVASHRATGKPKASVHHTVAHRSAEKATGADTDNVQSGDQTSPDRSGQASSGENARENSGESGTSSDGPGGHQDPPGANVDHQFQGQE